jgi:NADP-dependent aldehyde dehydrogenase
MGSVNPVFLLPEALAQRSDPIADGLATSVNMGVGQFCTCPGLAIGVGSAAFDNFAEQLRARFAQTKSGTMLTAAIAGAYNDATGHLSAMECVEATKGSGDGPIPALFETDAKCLLTHPELRHEVFGPSTILVRCESQAEMEHVARALDGSLTATLQGTEADLRSQSALLKILAHKAGRLIFNGYPTGVEVCTSMQHGGPYPATTDPRFTSVGTAAIVRFARPICYQDFPTEFLPEELR